MTALRPARDVPGTRTRALTIREAANATGINSRTIRRRLAAGVFPGAYKHVAFDQPDTLVWRIPIDDLQAAAIAPLDLSGLAEPDIDLTVIGIGPDQTSAESATVGGALESRPTAATLIGTDRFARLRSELAEAVASAELSLLRAEADKWRTVAEERAHALERADLALHTLSAFTPTETRADDETPRRPPPNREAVLYADSAGLRRAPGRSDAGRSDSPRDAWWRRAAR